MCGIAGICGLENSTDFVKRMITIQRHRGPDDTGYYSEDFHLLTLGYARLAIIDPEGGRQPMMSDDGRYIIVYNGEIYNSPVLRKELERTGKYNFKSDHSDTETLLYQFAEHGIDGLKALNGMYAFVIYDRVQQ
jgi:asparagine synthase (glutamine-hydrolysing)